MTLSLEFIDPYSTPFDRFVVELSEQLSSYNAPSSAEESSWRDWASIVVTIPEVAEAGVQDPAAFETWQDWSAALMGLLA